MELFTNLEIMIMVSVVGFLVLVILLLSILEFLSKKKENITIEVQDNKEDSKQLEEVKVETDEIVDAKEEEITLEAIENEVLALTKDYQEELKPLREEVTLEKEENLELEEIKPQVTIECLEPDEEEIEVLELEPEENKAVLELNKIKEELEHPHTLEDTINNLEQLEEESAIISYQELLSATQEMQVIEEDMEDEPISITEVYEKFTGEKMEAPSTMDIYEASIKTGIESENLNEIQLENTANLEKLDKEIRKTNKVLNMLNELKKNLD